MPESPVVRLCLVMSHCFSQCVSVVLVCRAVHHFMTLNQMLGLQLALLLPVHINTFRSWG